MSDASIETPSAGLLGWAAVGCVNAAMIALTLDRTAGTSLRVRLLQHLYDFGHMIALGLATWAALWVWNKWGPRRRIWGYAAIALVSSALALVLMADDLTSFLQRHPGLGQHWGYALASLAAGLGITSVAVLASVAVRRSLRWAALVCGVGLGVANHLVLQLNYPFVHLWTAWASALLLTGFMRTLPVPGRGLIERVPVREASLMLAFVGSGTSLLWIPNNTVWKELFRSSGIVLAPVLARLVPAQREVPLLIEGSPWFRDRSGMPSIAPSKPPLLNNPIVLLVTVDALRADVVANGKHANMLPALEALRKESLEFSMARSPSPSTVTTFMSMLTGKYYSGMYWSNVVGRTDGFKGAIMAHQDESLRMPALLSEAGVGTVHVLSLYGLGKGVAGPTGFQEELAGSRDYARAANVMDLILGRLGKQGDGPLFLYVHFVDSHAPYTLAGTQGTQYARYLREVALVDAQLARLRAFISKWHARDRTVLIVSADHGEAFGEHNTTQHAVTVYEELVRVPLLVWSPGVKHRVVDEPVSLIDLGPTVLDLFGQPTPAQFLGESLVPFLRGETPRLRRPIAVEGGRRLQALYLESGYKAVADLKRKTREVYDLKADPRERVNLVDIDPERASYALRALQAFFDAHAFHRDGYEPPWRPF